MGDTLAFRSDEGRGYQRNASGSWKQAMIRRSPNEETFMLLRESFLLSFPLGTKMFQFPRFTLTYLLIQ